MAKKLLTNKKEKWVRKFKPTAALRGTPLNYNAGIQEKYIRELEHLVHQMTTTTKKRIMQLYKSNTVKDVVAQDASVASQARILTNQLTKQFDELFGRKARPLAERMVEQTNQASKSNLHASMKILSGGLSLKTRVLTSPMKEVITASIAENVGLIKSIPAQYMKDVQGAVMRSITTGNGLQDLVPALEKYKGITERRAKNIALDQTRKAYNNINKGRMQAIGVQQFEWIHSYAGDKPRPYHKDVLNGQIYSFDDLPIIDENTGERGIPGQLINCKCTMRPVIKFNEGVQE